MNWYKILKFAQENKIAWIDKYGNTIPYVSDDHYLSLFEYYNINMYPSYEDAKKIIDKNKLIRVYVYGNTVNFSLSFGGITHAQRGKMLDILVDNNIFNGFIDTFKGPSRFNSFKEFKRILQTL